MKVIRNINNNVAICLDSNNHEVVAFGKGIGFGKPPYDVPLCKIYKTYANIDVSYIKMLENIPKDIFEISIKIVEYAKDTIDNFVAGNMVFTLADHIGFVIERHKKQLNIKLPLVYDVKYLFEKEYQVGEYGLKLIRDRKKIYLPEEEASYIAMHIINAEEKSRNSKTIDSEEVIAKITDIVERECKIVIDKSSFDYSRFVTHLHYLFKRGEAKEFVKTCNEKMYDNMKNDYPEIYICSEKIASYLLKSLKMQLTDEEKLYLMLHINRVCTREDCN